MSAFEIIGRIALFLLGCGCAFYGVGVSILLGAFGGGGNSRLERGIVVGIAATGIAIASAAVLA